MTYESRNHLKLHHANLKMKDGKGEPVELFLNRDLIFYWFYSESTKCTVVHSNGASLVPVMESVEELTNLMERGNNG